MMSNLWAPNSGSVYAADGVIPHSACKRLVWLALIADEDAAAYCDITDGSPAASTIMSIRSASGRMSPVIGPIVAATCLTIANLADGDVIALIRKRSTHG